MTRKTISMAITGACTAGLILLLELSPFVGTKIFYGALAGASFLVFLFLVIDWMFMGGIEE